VFSLDEGLHHPGSMTGELTTASRFTGISAAINRRFLPSPRRGESGIARAQIVEDVGK